MAYGFARILAGTALVLTLGGAGETDPELAAAFLAVFGQTGPVVVTTEASGDENTLHFAPGALVETPFAMVLLSPASADMPSPVTYGALGVHYLQAQGQGFRVTGSWPEAVAGGPMGNPPDWQIDRSLAANPVILAQTLEGNQGIFSEYVQLVELTPQGPHSLVTFRSSFSDSSEADKTGREITGKIANIVRDKSFDVEFTGSASFRQTFTRKGDTYEMTQSTGELPSL